MQAFRESKLEESEGWMAQAFAFSNFSSALAPWREELNEGYNVCIKMLNEDGRRSSKGADDWATRMGKRILEADDEIRKRRKIS